MFYDILFGRLTTINCEITARCIAIMNRADPDLIKFMEFMVNRCDPSKGETYATARKLGQEHLDNCRGVAGQPPLCNDGEDFLSDPYTFLIHFSNHIHIPTAPRTEITEKGDIAYSEVNRRKTRGVCGGDGQCRLYFWFS
jgi:fatty acid synthase subunit alpha, fungi type